MSVGGHPHNYKLSWKPKYKLGDEVYVYLSLRSKPYKESFCAKGIVLLINEHGYYRLEITRIFLDTYFTYNAGKPKIKTILTVHFDSVERAKIEEIVKPLDANTSERMVFS